MNTILLIAFLIIPIILLFYYWRRDKWVKPDKPFPKKWRILLAEEVPFYNALDQAEKQQFEYKVQEFLLNYRITGIQTKVELVDQLLIAASGVIPIFKFPDWRYTNLFEILLYPSAFDEQFKVSGPGRNILGMVGTGYMEGKMILSKPALHHGFDNKSDKRNTAIHEFIHLIDKLDGSVDGIPEVLLEKPYVIPWLDLISEKIEDIYEDQSDIDPYGATNKAEFFAVAGEYFFERPRLLAKKHPELYKLLEEVFDQNMYDRDLNKRKLSIGRNSPCPCGSNVKFKKCCGKGHY